MISRTFSGTLPRPTWLARKPIATGTASARPSSSMAAPGPTSPRATAAMVETYRSTICRISRMYSIADWTALKNAMAAVDHRHHAGRVEHRQQLRPATLSMISVMIQSLAVFRIVSHRLPSWPEMNSQIADDAALLHVLDERPGLSELVEGAADLGDPLRSDLLAELGPQRLHGHAQHLDAPG